MSQDQRPLCPSAQPWRSMGLMAVVVPASLDVSAAARARGFVALTKPRIIELLLVTTIPTMFVAERGLPRVTLMVATLIGGTLAAGGANAINMVVDRDIDSIMRRTRNRPLVTGLISPTQALVFAVGLEVAAFAELWATVNLLSALLAVSATAFYVFVYTMWLKRTSKQNIVVGGAAGAVPVLVGWAAVRGSIGLAPVVLFALMFLWTPPHFWALAIRYRDDYRSVEVPMLPAVASIEKTTAQILFYTVLVVVASAAFGLAAGLGPLYWSAAALGGAAFVLLAARLWRRPSEQSAMTLFHWSISYVTVLFAAMAVDVLVFH